MIDVARVAPELMTEFAVWTNCPLAPAVYGNTVWFASEFSVNRQEPESAIIFGICPTGKYVNCNPLGPGTLTCWFSTRVSRPVFGSIEKTVMSPKQDPGVSVWPLT